MDTLADRLLAELQEIARLVNSLLDASTIDWKPERAARLAAETGVMLISLSDGQWGPSDDRQKLLQRKALERWTPWLEQVCLLFSEDTSARRRSIEDAARNVERWISRDRDTWSIPQTIAEAKPDFARDAEQLAQHLRSLGSASDEPLVVPDTNVILRSPDIANYGAVLDGATRYTVLLVPGVLGELDSHKVNHRNPDVRAKASKFTGRIKGWRNQGKLADGVKVAGHIYVRVEGREPDLTKSLSWLQADVVDDRIVASILEIQRRNPTSRVVLLTGDTLMLAKADMANIPTRDTPEPDIEEQKA